MSKPPTRPVPSDDYVLTVDGVEYHPHEGEQVEFIGSTTVGEMQAFNRFRRLSVSIDAVKGEADEAQKINELMDPAFEQLCELLARRLVRWSWTDDAGRPLPQPDAPEVLKALCAEEVYYLLIAAQGESAGERKNGSSVSPTTSSATAPPPTTRRTGAPNRTKG
jgi:hypothetical protein